MRILGCDPGVTGALVLIDHAKDTIEWFDMPIIEIEGKKRIDHATLSGVIETLRPDCAVVERVTSSPQMGVTSAFNFGQSFASIVQALACHKVKYELVPPNVWTRAMGVKAKEPDSSRQRASMLMPAFARAWTRKSDHGRSDAALLSLYGKQYVWLTK